MKSRLKIRDVEVTKLKEDHKLMIKQLGGRRSDQIQQVEVIAQVEYLQYAHIFQRVWKLDKALLVLKQDGVARSIKINYVQKLF